MPFRNTSSTVTFDGKKQRGIDGQPMATRSIAAYLDEHGYDFRGRPYFHGNLNAIPRREHCAGSYRDRTADDQDNKPSESEAVVVECPKMIDPSIMLSVAAKRAKAAPRVTAPRMTT